MGVDTKRRGCGDNEKWVWRQREVGVETTRSGYGDNKKWVRDNEK